MRARFWTPSTALVKGVRGLWSCYVVEPGPANEVGVARVEARDVEVLHVDERRAFVRGALAPGDLVVSSGAHRIVPAQRVHVVGE